MATYRDFILRDAVFFIMEDSAPADTDYLFPFHSRQVEVESIRVVWTATNNGGNRKLVVDHILTDGTIVSTLNANDITATKNSVTEFSLFPGVPYDRAQDITPKFNISGVAGLRVRDLQDRDAAGDRYTLIVHGKLLRKTT